MLINYSKEIFKERLKEDNEDYYEIKVKKINKKGEVTECFSKGVKKKQAKKGWCSMYKKDMQEVLFELANYPTAQKVWLILWDYMKKDGTLKPFTQNKIAEILKTKRQVVNRAIKKLRWLEIIEKIDGEWRYNPFIFTVSGMTDKEKYEAQQIWEKHIGHYKQQ